MESCQRLRCLNAKTSPVAASPDKHLRHKQRRIQQKMDMCAGNHVIQGLRLLFRQTRRIIEHQDLPSSNDDIKRTKNAGDGRDRER